MGKKKNKTGAARAKKPAYQKRFREHVREQREVPLAGSGVLALFCGDDRAEAAESVQNAASVAFGVLDVRCGHDRAQAAELAVNAPSAAFGVLDVLVAGTLFHTHRGS